MGLWITGFSRSYIQARRAVDKTVHELENNELKPVKHIFFNGLIC